MRALRVTVDTNMLDSNDMRSLRGAARQAGVEIDVTTISVSTRERGWADASDLGLWPDSTTPETAVWGESRWGEAVWGGSELLVLDETPLDTGVLGGPGDGPRLEAILGVIASGSFPPRGERDHLSDPQKRQLRDAMILEAHAREGRDVFVTRDARGFVKHGKREQLQQLCATVIVHPDEFTDYCRRYASSGTVPRGADEGDPMSTDPDGPVRTPSQP